MDFEKIMKYIVLIVLILGFISILLLIASGLNIIPDKEQRLEQTRIGQLEEWDYSVTNGVAFYNESYCNITCENYTFILNIYERDLDIYDGFNLYSSPATIIFNNPTCTYICYGIFRGY